MARTPPSSFGAWRLCLGTGLVLAGACLVEKNAYIGPRPVVPLNAQNVYGAAAVAAGVALGGAALHRVRTRRCYAECWPGSVCDESTGYCLRDCESGCPTGSRCQTVRGRRWCVLGNDAGADAASDADGSADAETDAGADASGDAGADAEVSPASDGDAG